jgi:hypothetical protein
VDKLKKEKEKEKEKDDEHKEYNNNSGSYLDVDYHRNVFRLGLSQVEALERGRKKRGTSYFGTYRGSG